MITAVDTSILLEVFVDAEDADQSKTGRFGVEVKLFGLNIETKDHDLRRLCRYGTL